MCGIAGVMAGPSQAPVGMEELRRMVAMLGHRGPDGYGLFRDERAGLAHARLSIVDLAGGFQPIRNADATIWMTFNGEIFNYIELRRQLLALGHRFYTNGDSEVIVHCYEQFGAKAWEMLNGQFALALWDSRKKEMWLVRDRLGILPLHYALVGDTLVFASGAKAIFAGGRLAPRLDPAGLAEAFTNWSATAPGTVFAGVSQLPPATALCFDSRMQARWMRYWEPDPSRHQLDDLSAADAAAALHEQLVRSVNLRLRADVPVGAYISGGLDSSVIGSLAKEVAGVPLETFGIGFEEERYDESSARRVVTDTLGTRHHEFVCSNAHIRDALGSVVWHCETPLLRTSPAPLYLLAGHARAAGIKTVLTGEGADELLAGYTIFKEDQIRRFWARQPASKLRPALLSRIHHYIGNDGARQSPLWQDFFRRGLEDTSHPFYSHMVRWTNNAWTLRLLAPEIRGSLDLETMMTAAEADLPSGWRQWDPLTRAQMIEIRGFMSSYLLSSQGDRVAMANGLEVRYPFLDPKLVDFCLCLPKRHKLLGTRDKLALRRVAANLRLPQSVWSRPKQPYRAPITNALLGSPSEPLPSLLSEGNLSRSGLFDTGAINRLLMKAKRPGGALGEREEMGLTGVLTLATLQDSFGAGFANRASAARARLERNPPHVLVDHVPAAG